MISWSFRLSIHLYIRPSILLFVRLSSHAPICPSIYLAVRPSVRRIFDRKWISHYCCGGGVYYGFSRLGKTFSYQAVLFRSPFFERGNLWLD